jgi:hypothetical protein
MLLSASWQTLANIGKQTLLSFLKRDFPRA